MAHLLEETHQVVQTITQWVVQVHHLRKCTMGELHQLSKTYTLLTETHLNLQGTYLLQRPITISI